jgi:hypothetical protein
MGALSDIVGLVRATDDASATSSGDVMARLDGFIFKRAALDECAEAVARHDQSSSLAFGLPGWERFLAGLGLQLGGAMIDVGELFRQRNGPRKEMPESYRHSSTAVAPHAGPSVAASHPSVQGDLHDLIDRQCQIHAVYTRMIRLSLAEAAGAPGGSSPSLPTWHRSANDPLAALRGWMDDADIQRLHDGQIRSPDWRALYTAFQLLEVGMTPLSAYLEALTAAVRLGMVGEACRWTTRYPTGSPHAKQLGEALAETQSGIRQRRLLQLFAADLHEHRVLNLNLLKYLLTQCRHEMEQRQFRALLGQLKERVDGPTAAA